MPFPTFIELSFGVEALLLLFHVSMFAVIARNVVKKIAPFSTAFYKIYLAQSVVDYCEYAW
ncbi:hypothetical protein AAVH_19569, partial [Aphelenchoides avenae]